jgi:hypothetical protein
MYFVVYRIYKVISSILLTTTVFRIKPSFVWLRKSDPQNAGNVLIFYQREGERGNMREYR